MVHSGHRYWMILGAMGLTAVLYQNCSRGFSAKESNSTDSASSDLQTAACLFNGQSIVPGASVTAYSLPNVPTGQSCVSQTRICSDGVLSGTYANTSCIVTPAGDCALGGQDIKNGATATGYTAQQVAPGQSCSSVAATAACNNGVLSATLYPTCTVATAASCQFNGQYITSGTSITAYLAGSVPYGSSCSSELRTCNNGVLSGSFTAATCTAAAAANCRLGATVVDNGESVQVFSTNMVAYGQSCTTVQEPITCNNGVFDFADGSLASNNYYTSCAPASTTSCQLNNQTLKTGDSVSGYLQQAVPVGQTCNKSTATCDNGVITGVPLPTPDPNLPPGFPGKSPGNLYIPLYNTCDVGGCVFEGILVANQTSVTGYTSNIVAHSGSCTSVQTTLTCNNGALTDPSGKAASGLYASCSPAATTSCSFSNWANALATVTVTSGQTITGYASATVLENTTCSSVQENVSCNDGIISLNGVAEAPALTGIFNFYSTCNVGACISGSQTYLDGASISGYTNYFVAYGQSCSSIQSTFTCKNSAVYQGSSVANDFNPTCAAQSSPNCQVNDYSNITVPITIQNGQSYTGFTMGSAGSACANDKVTLTCSEGLISANGGTPVPMLNYEFFSVCK